jgi:hypothetical protein
MHELGNGVSTTDDTLSQQLLMNARRTIRPAARYVDFPDVRGRPILTVDRRCCEK